MENNSSNINFVTDEELLVKALFYFDTLRRVVPRPYLVDSCSGILVLIDTLLRYLDKQNISDYGNHEK